MEYVIFIVADWTASAADLIVVYKISFDVKSGPIGINLSFNEGPKIFDRFEIMKG